MFGFISAPSRQGSSNHSRESVAKWCVPLLLLTSWIAPLVKARVHVGREMRAVPYSPNNSHVHDGILRQLTEDGVSNSSANEFQNLNGYAMKQEGDYNDLIVERLGSDGSTTLTIYYNNMQNTTQIEVPGNVITAACSLRNDNRDQLVFVTEDQNNSLDATRYEYGLDEEGNYVKLSEYHFNQKNDGDVRRQDIGKLYGECKDRSSQDESVVVYTNNIQPEDNQINPGQKVSTFSVLIPTVIAAVGKLGRWVYSPSDSESFDYIFPYGNYIYGITKSGGLSVYQFERERGYTEEGEGVTSEPVLHLDGVFPDGLKANFDGLTANLERKEPGKPTVIGIYSMSQVSNDNPPVKQSVVFDSDMQVLDHKFIRESGTKKYLMVHALTQNQKIVVFILIKNSVVQTDSRTYILLNEDEHFYGRNPVYLVRESEGQPEAKIVDLEDLLNKTKPFTTILPEPEPSPQPTSNSFFSNSPTLESEKPTSDEGAKPTTSPPSFIPTTLAPSSRSTTMAPAIAPTTIAHPSRTTTSMPSVTPTAESPTLSQMLKDMITGQPSVAPLSDIPTVLTIIADTPTLQPIMDALVADGSSKKSRSLLTELPLPYMLIVMTAASASICLILLCIKLVFVWNRDRDHQTGSIFSYLPPKQNNIPNPDTPEVPERLL